MVPLQPEHHYDPATGWRTFKRWMGDHDDAITMANSLVGTGVRINVTPNENSPKSILSVEEAGDGTGSPATQKFGTWELVTSIESEDNWYHPTPAAYLRSLTPTQIGTFVAEVTAYETKGTLPPSFGSLPSDALRDFVVSRGTQDITWFCPKMVLRAAITVARNSTVYSVDYGQRLTVYTTDQLLATSLVADFPLPETIRTLPDGFWLSLQPAQVEQNDGRVQINYEFVFSPEAVTFNTGWKYVASTIVPT